MSMRLSPTTLAGIGIAFAALLVYANSLLNGFAFDDIPIVLQNARVHDLGDLRAIWLTPYWPFLGEEFGLYRPLTIFAYAVQWRIGGGEPWLFHAVSVAMHAGVALLVLRLLLYFVPLAGAAAGALVFAVHPVHTEAVANVIGQAELIAALATVGACLLHARRAPGCHVSWPLRAAHVALFLVAVLAKESALSLPLLLVVVDIAQRRFAWTRQGVEGYVRAMAMPAILIAAAAIVYLGFRVDALGSLRGVNLGPSLPYLREEHRVLTAFRAWPEFARLMFFPADLSAEYGPGVIVPMTALTPMVALGMMIFGATLATALLLARSPLVALPAAWFLVSMLLVSNLLFPIGVLVAERLLYTPSVAVAFVVGAAVTAAWQSSVRRRRLAIATITLAVIAMGARTWIRNPDWKDNSAVFTAMNRDRPEAYRPYWTNAAVHTVMNELEKAEPFWRVAYALWPRDPSMLTEYGAFLNRTGRFEQALPMLEYAVEQVPWAARSHLVLAETYLALGRPAEALERLNRGYRIGAVELRIFYAQLGRAYDGIGDDALALAAWRTAARKRGGQHWLIHAMLARAASRYGLHDEAREAAASAVEYAAEAGEPAVAAAAAAALAVDNGCYRRGADPACADPLVAWSLIGETFPTQPAKQLHTASPPAAHPPPRAFEDVL
jgi:protein O-mannosyl-transferase